MRKYMYGLSLFIVWASCRKTTNELPLTQGSLQLAQIKLSNSNNNTVFYKTCTYDEAGRLTNMSVTDRNGVQLGGYQIRYPDPSTVIMKEWIEQANVYGNEVTFILDGQGRPAARYQQQFFRRAQPHTWSDSFDSTFFQYGPDGLLEISFARNNDTVSAPGVNNGGVYRSQYSDTTYFTNTGGDLVSTRSVGTENVTRYDNNRISRETGTLRSTTTFDYSMGVKLGNYGKNAFLYQEFNMLGIKPHPFYLPYSRMASKTTVTKEKLNPITGQWGLVSSVVQQFDPSSVFTYNPVNLLTRIAYTDAALGLQYFSDFSYK